jgi:hypothetical protein
VGKAPPSRLAVSSRLEEEAGLSSFADANSVCPEPYKAARKVMNICSTGLIAKSRCTGN